MMDNKQLFLYTGKKGIAEAEKFNEKGLASYSVNLGNICEFGCSYCYVPSITLKQKTVQDVLKKGYTVDDISSYRPRNNVLECVAKDLKKISSDDNNYVFFCTTCDPCATEEHTETTIDAIRLIMEGSSLQVRVLSKSALITRVAKSLIDYKERITYSLSTGTASSPISKAIEERASSITDRVHALQWLQDKGFRTYGMICPVLPSEVDNLKQLLDQVRPDLCEGVWGEAVNVRGRSLENTLNKLKEAGLEEDAKELQWVMGNKKVWIEYAKNLFLGFQKEMRDRELLDKLHFLQYVSKHDREFYEGNSGAVCLYKKKKKTTI